MEDDLKNIRRLITQQSLIGSFSILEQGTKPKSKMLEIHLEWKMTSKY
jgi:hypothetical protein